MKRPALPKRAGGRRSEDRWVARMKILKELLLIVSACATGIFSAYIGQKSNDPALENKYSLQRIEDAQRLRADNDRLRAQIEEGQK